MVRLRSWKVNSLIIISIIAFVLAGISLGISDLFGIVMGFYFMILFVVYWLSDLMRKEERKRKGKKKKRRGYYYPIIPGSDIYFPRSDIPRPIYGEMEELKKTKKKILNPPHFKKRRKKR